VAIASLGAAAMMACSDSGDAKSGDGPTASNDIIGGVDAKGHGLDAVGAIVAADATTTVDFCNGTLIAPKLVLTSKRCAVQYESVTPDGGAPTQVRTVLVDKYPLYFITGANIASPSHKVRIESVDLCTSPDTGGMDGFGCNVAVYRLQEAIADITPLPFTDKALGSELVGQRFSTVGYGDISQDLAKQTLGQRHAGTLTLRAVSGAPMKAIFPTEADLVAAWTKAEGQASAQQLSAALASYYETTLQPDLEAWLGGSDGDAQTCLDDQGSPLLAKNAEGKLTVFGIASNPLGGSQTKCIPFGAPYAMLGAAAQALISKNLVDACDTETSAGRCDGDIAVRCTTPAEGDRRITRSDCGAVLQHCVPPSATNPQVSCAD
jgi:hypothetical protein